MALERRLHRLGKSDAAVRRGTNAVRDRSSALSSKPDLRLAMASASLAAAVSTVVLLWRGRRETPSAPAPLNAVSHWLWRDEALQHDFPSARHTATGLLIHALSSLWWACVFSWLRTRGAHTARRSAVVDAAAVTAAAALVDLRLVPSRFTPGFERRLSTRSLAAVYLAFAIGLALAARRDEP